jgi:hypothetical protein
VGAFYHGVPPIQGTLFILSNLGVLSGVGYKGARQAVALQIVQEGFIPTGPKIKRDDFLIHGLPVYVFES